MRIVSRKAFLALPEGTLFCKGQPWAFGQISVKGETLPAHDAYPGDFIYRDLTDVAQPASGDWFSRLDQMLEQGASFPVNVDDWCRDGTFDDDDVFLVFELEDLNALQSAVEQARALAA